MRRHTRSNYLLSVYPAQQPTCRIRTQPPVRSRAGLFSLWQPNENHTVHNIIAMLPHPHLEQDTRRQNSDDIYSSVSSNRLYLHKVSHACQVSELSTYLTTSSVSRICYFPAANLLPWKTQNIWLTKAGLEQILETRLNTDRVQTRYLSTGISNNY